VMKYNTKNPLWPHRDRLILSKAHGCYGLYAILADIGFIPPEVWRSFYKQPGPLWGCAERMLDYGIEASCGSLGHGLPMAVGLALGAKLQSFNYHTFCIVGDGEMQEGSNWEAIQFAVKHRLDNLTIIVDTNGLQAMDFTINIMDRAKNDLFHRLSGFGLSPTLCPGHNPGKLADALEALQSSNGPVPTVILAQTVKGYGLKCMENVPRFHFRLPTTDELPHELSCETVSRLSP